MNEPTYDLRIDIPGSDHPLFQTEERFIPIDQIPGLPLSYLEFIVEHNRIPFYVMADGTLELQVATIRQLLDQLRSRQQLLYAGEYADWLHRNGVPSGSTITTDGHWLTVKL
jgi:hypothetical protein